MFLITTLMLLCILPKSMFTLPDVGLGKIIIELLYAFIFLNPVMNEEKLASK